MTYLDSEIGVTPQASLLIIFLLLSSWRTTMRNKGGLGSHMQARARAIRPVDIVKRLVVPPAVAEREWRQASAHSCVNES